MLLQELSRSNIFDPFREVERLQHQLNRLFEGYSSRATAEFPAMNIWTSEESAVITAELPGLCAEDIDISIVNDILTLRGSRQPEQLQEGETLHRKERGFGQFTRTIQLPFRVDADKVQATFKSGILNLALPRAEQDKPRKITINCA